jgi:NTE family protein
MATVAATDQPVRLARDVMHPVTAFVVSDGATLAAVQVGMLEPLYEHDVAPDFPVGTSAGALNAAFISSRVQTVETARELRRVWRGPDRKDVFPVSLTALVGGMSRRRGHLVPDRVGYCAESCDRQRISEQGSITMTIQVPPLRLGQPNDDGA